jgi:hypothetical protein
MGAAARAASHGRSRRSKGRSSNQLDIRVVLGLRVDDHSLGRHRLVGRCRKRFLRGHSAFEMRCDASFRRAEACAFGLRMIRLVLSRLVCKSRPKSLQAGPLITIDYLGSTYLPLQRGTSSGSSQRTTGVLLPIITAWRMLSAQHDKRSTFPRFTLCLCPACRCAQLALSCTYMGIRCRVLLSVKSGICSKKMGIDRTQCRLVAL